jgi:amidase
VRDGAVRAVSVVEAHLQRIAEMDPRLGALSAVRHTEALREADALQRRDDLAALPLAGVPVVVKENIDVAGLPTLHGSAATVRTPADVDDELVGRLRAAGAIVIAKSHMPELAIWPVTESAICNARNPYDMKRTPGGSSGGSAAAVAARMATLAIGSDGGGSVRIPAACCGIVGVKTTPGLVPLPGGAASHWYGLSVVGPLARSVDDAALMLDVLAGTARFRDPQPPAETLQVSVSWKHPLLGARADDETQAAVQTVADTLRHAGHDVAPADPPYPPVPTAFLRCFLAGIAEDADTLGLDVTKVEPRTRALVARGRWVRRRGLDRQARNSQAARRLTGWISQRDVLVVPVLAGPPPEVGRWWGQNWMHTTFSAGNWMGFNPPWNLAGCPSVAMPVTLSRLGMPIAVQLVGAPGSEARLLSVGKLLEGSPARFTAQP